MATNNNTDINIVNPWKGLNFYHEGEILYGRDDEIQSLALYVTNNTQTVLYGKSGIGKSSIINAGVFPIARKEGLFPIPIRLKHDSDTNYTSQIIAAFKESNIGITEILKPLGESNETLWEYLHRNTFYDINTDSPVRPLIVLDQFEEIFTLQHDEKKKLSFFSELADLLNEITPDYIAKSLSVQTDSAPIIPKLNDNGFSLDFGVTNDSDESKIKKYVSDSLFNIVFTIREDFLSYLERYTKYIPVMKSNRYALLPINEEQAKDIIMRPVEGLVDIDVAKLIIEKVTGRTDFKLGDDPEIEVDAAVLSLFLSRIFIKKKEDESTITAALVNESSKDIIKDFYNESVEDLPSKEIEKLENSLLTYDNRRDNVSRNDLIREGVSDSTIQKLVEDRKLLRQFSYQDDLRIEFIHDILCPIVNDRIEHREQLAKEREAKRKEAEEEARRKREKAEEDARIEKERLIQEEKLRKAEEEKQILLRQQKLQEEENRLLQRKQEEELTRAEREKKHQKEQLARAEEERKLLLRQQEIQEEEKKLILRKQEEERIQQEREKKELEEKAIAEKEAMEAKALRIKKKNHKRFVALISTIVFLVALAGISITIYYFATKHVYEEYYQSYTLENGWPKGVGEPLSKEDAYNLTISYRLWKEGFLTKHINRVSIYGRGGQQTVARTPISTIIVSEEDAQGSDERASKALDLLHRTHYIYFRQDSESEESVQQLCYDKEGDDKLLLYTINLFKEGDAVWNVFYDSEGKTFPMRDNGADRVKIFRNHCGLDSLCYIYDSQGVPQSNKVYISGGYPISFYGQDFVYNKDLRQDSIFFLDEFGLRRKVVSYKYLDNQSSVTVIDSIAPSELEHIFSIRFTYDNHGDCINEISYNSSNNMIDSLSFQYDDLGRNIFQSRYCNDDNISTELQISYLDKSFSIREKVCKKGKGKSPSSWETISFYRERYENEIKHIEQKDDNGNYSHQIVKQLDSETEEICFVDSDGLPTIDSVEVCHRKVTRIHHNSDGTYYETEYYYGLDKKTLYSADKYTYAIDSMVFDSYGHRIARVQWDKEMNIISSYRIEYEGGRELVRYAMGVDGQPIRCPQWECEGLNYYKLQSVRKNDGKSLVYLRSIDEYGLPCFLYNGLDAKGAYVIKSQRDMGMGWMEFSCDSILIPPIPNNATPICYLHILNIRGEAYRQGLRDGDILLNRIGESYNLVTVSALMKISEYVGERLFYVIRYHPDTKGWSLHKAQLHKETSAGAEIYPIYYTKEEMSILRKGLKAIK